MTDADQVAGPAEPDRTGPYRSVRSGPVLPAGNGPIAAPRSAAGDGAPQRWLLVSTYDLGRQPVALAAMAAALRGQGHHVEVVDLSVEQIDVATAAGRFHVVLWSLPMHTATRLALDAMARLAVTQPQLSQAAFGLYAELNEGLLGSLGVAVVRHGADPPRFDRRGLPGLDHYARLVLSDGTQRVVGTTEASIGCRHRCRHCPVVPVFDGRFRPVAVEDVLDDVTALVEAGAEHITFGDPDFLNGPAHGLRVATALHRRFPRLSFDITAKVEHLHRHRRLLAPLRDAGCVLITSAVESFDDLVLQRLDKGHTAADVAEVVAACRSQDIGVNPTLVPFTPWTTMATFRRLLDGVEELGLIDAVHPVQYGVRLLVTARSGLLELHEVASLVGPFDAQALAHPWRHPDPAIDALQREVMRLVRAEAQHGQGPAGRRALHRALRHLTDDPAGHPTDDPAGHPTDDPARDGAGGRQDAVAQPATIAWFTEPWFC